MEPDKFSENFAKVLFNYLWFAEKLISETEVVQIINEVVMLEGDIVEFVREAAKAVVFLSVFYVPSFFDTAEDYFQRNTVRGESVTAYLARHCFKSHAETEDIFAAVLNTCTFTYRLIVLCQRMGHEKYLRFAASYWSSIFEMELKIEFHAKGGWDVFKTYVHEKRYAGGICEQHVIEAFMDEIDYFFPMFENVNEDAQASCFSSEATADFQKICAEIMDESLTNGEGDEIQVVKVESNVSDFNEKSRDRMKGVDNPQTNFDATEVSFGTVDQIASNIPEFNDKSKAVVFQYDNSNAKIVKLSKKSKSKSRSKLSLPKIDPVIISNVLEESKACTLMQYTESLSTNSQSNSTNSSTESTSESEDVGHKFTDQVLRTAIEKDQNDEMIQENACKEIQDSEIKDTAPKAFSNIGNCFSSVSEKNVVIDDQASLKDFLSRQTTGSSFAADTELLPAKIYINGVCIEKYVKLTVKKVGTDYSGDNSEGASGTSETTPYEKDQNKDPVSHQTTGSPNKDNMNSENCFINIECFDKYVKLLVKETETDSNATAKDVATDSNEREESNRKR